MKNKKNIMTTVTNFSTCHNQKVCDTRSSQGPILVPLLENMFVSSHSRFFYIIT